MCKENKSTLEQPEIETFLQSRRRNDSLASNNQQRKSLDQTNTTDGNVNNDDSCIVVSPQRNQRLPTLLLDSQDSQLASPQPVVPQHCQRPTTLSNSQHVDNLSPIIDLQHNLQSTVVVTPQLPVSTHDAEQPPPVQTSSKGINSLLLLFLST